MVVRITIFVYIQLYMSIYILNIIDYQYVFSNKYIDYFNVYVELE